MGLLVCWQGKLGRHRNSHIWLIVSHCLMWCLWRERNSRFFEDNERSILDLKLFFFRTLLDWLATFSQPIILFLSWFSWFLWFLFLICWPLVLGCPFLISIKLITYQKKQKNSKQNSPLNPESKDTLRQREGGHRVGEPKRWKDSNRE